MRGNAIQKKDREISLRQEEEHLRRKGSEDICKSVNLLARSVRSFCLIVGVFVKKEVKFIF